MSRKNTTKWLGAYLYYNEPWEEFLVEGIRPYIQTALSTGIAQQFFFIRYWDRGPHIRLRFKGEAESIDNILRPNLTEHFYSYFDSRPSARKDPAYPDDLPAAHHWLPNNSLYFVDYEPEFHRYGGLRGIDIAEQHFQHSSEVVLQNLSNRVGQWSYDEALGMAIKLHLCFVHSLGMSLHTMHDFFHYLFYNWLPASVRAYRQGQTPKAYQQRVKATLEAFNRAYTSQQKVILPFQLALWEALDEQASFEDEALNQWVSQLKWLRSELRKSNRAGALQLPPLRGNDLPEARPEQEFWELYTSYIHMTNNRLGILNRDEGYVAYLMMQGSKYLIRQEGKVK
ncbi:MAG: lantibiotic dehydratase C-terminal domain-containing protein [Bacteroidota bacterium]